MTKVIALGKLKPVFASLRLFDIGYSLLSLHLDIHPRIFFLGFSFLRPWIFPVRHWIFSAISSLRYSSSDVFSWFFFPSSLDIR
jgi:hypothetical protein